jgi:hypothetical protein
LTLTVTDIERWDGGDVREVFHAATSRAQAAFDGAVGLALIVGPLSGWLIVASLGVQHYVFGSA